MWRSWKSPTSPSSPSSPVALLRSLLRSTAVTTTPNTHSLHHLPRPFSSISSAVVDDDLARSFSHELVTNASADPDSLCNRLHQTFPKINPSNPLIHQVLNLSTDATGRSVLAFQNWLSSNPDFTPSEETYSLFVNYFGRHRDFTSIHDLLLLGKGVIGSKTLASVVDRYARGGRAHRLALFFEKMESEYGLVRNRESLGLVVEKMCERGFALKAEKMVKSLANEFFPDERISDLLIKGWCTEGRLDEAERLAGEMQRGGFDIGAMAYNSVLDAVCKLCREKEPLMMQVEADKILVSMDMACVPRDVDTFNVLIESLCKIRRTDDAVNWFRRMGEWGCKPNGKTFLTLIRSLFQAARIGEGDEMIDGMKSAGFGEELDRIAYFGFLRILCGIERIDHAMSVFDRMKEDGCQPGIKTYDLLMGRLVAHGRVDEANALFKEAADRGVPVEPKAYKLGPRFVEKDPVKKEKRRETLQNKMAKKKRRLNKIRLSFVKGPKKGRRRAY